jgi:protease IV
MEVSSDNVLNSYLLRKQVRRWKMWFLVILFAFLLSIFINSSTDQLSDHIARVNIDDIIYTDLKRQNKLEEIYKNNAIKAVIVHVNSPGGTVVGSESVYKALRKISNIKPVVTVMDDIATSGGYMAAIGGDYIFASRGSMTGSIGVLLESTEATKLLEKIGVEFHSFKSTTIKGSPMMFEKITPEAVASMNRLVNDNYVFFKDLVKERRKLSESELAVAANGEVFSGDRALQYKLIDAIGDEDDAIKWLIANKNISESMPIRDFKIVGKKEMIEEFIANMMVKISSQFMMNNINKPLAF